MDIDEKENIKSLIRQSTIMLSDDTRYNKCLKITIPKFVISDSRPKKGIGKSFYNENKIMLMDIFNIVYENDELLKNTTILGKYFVKLIAYIRPTTKVEKIFSEDLLATEEIECVSIKDNDNIEKVHWDVLQDEKFHIILDDSFISCNTTVKYWSYNPRVEILIYFDSKEYSDEYMKIMTGLEKYKKYLCTKKAYESPDVFWERIKDTKIKNHSGSNNKLLSMFKSYNVKELDELLRYIEPDNPCLKIRNRNKKINEIYLIYLRIKNGKGI